MGAQKMAGHVTRIPTLSLLLVFLGITQLAQSKIVLKDGCIKPGTYNRKTNYMSTAFRREPFARKVKNSYNFRVRYAKSFKVVEDLSVGTRYVLYHCGAPIPKAGSGVYLSVPLKEYSVSDDTSASALQLLGVQRFMKAAPMKSMVEPCMQKVIANLPASSPSLPKFSGFFSATAFVGNNISFSASFERTPLRRAEWIKYVSLFFNREKRAMDVYNFIKAKYACNKRKALAVMTPKLTVGWLSYSTYGGISWTLSAAGYKTSYVRDAGGVNPEVLSSRNDKVFFFTNDTETAKFHAFLSQLDVVIDETYLSSGPSTYSIAKFQENAQLSDAQVASIPWLNNGRLWSIYGLIAPGAYGPSTGWYEGAIAQPQVVLQELVSILRPSVYPKGIPHSFLYDVSKVGSFKYVTAANCAVNPYSTYRPYGAGCK